MCRLNDRFDLEAARTVLADVIRDGWLDASTVHDWIIEACSERGEQLFYWEWDSAGPGAGGGCETVSELAGRYFVVSVDYGLHGPYPSFEAAMEAAGFDPEEEAPLVVNEATVAVATTEWDEEEVIRKMDLERHEPPGRLEINGEHWYLEELEWEQEKLRRGAGEEDGEE